MGTILEMTPFDGKMSKSTEDSHTFFALALTCIRDIKIFICYLQKVGKGYGV